MKVATDEKRSALSRYNHLLSYVNILVALYIFITPLLPGIIYFFNQRFGGPPTVYAGKLSDATNTPRNDNKPDGNRLVIPSIRLDKQINEGASESTLNHGVWRRPNSSTPPESSNTVLAGHVFTYTTPAGVFYNLGKIKLGDKLAVYWENKEYLYEVAAIDTVDARAGFVESATKYPQLTLYTCTPLWNPVKRLVARAVLLEVTPL